MKFNNRIKEIDVLNQKINQFRPFNQHVLKQLKEYFRISLTYSSNAIEGNTLTETETKIVLEDGITIAGKPLRDHLEAQGHSNAFDFICEICHKKTISENDIREIHRLFYFRIDEENAGKYRKLKVIITGSEFIPPAPAQISKLMKKFVMSLPALRGKCHPVEFAALVHKNLVDIHPFIDGNGRTARLLMNLVLFQQGYGVTIIPPIMRSEYIACLRRSHKGEKVDNTEFIDFISGMVYESTKDFLRLLKSLH